MPAASSAEEMNLEKHEKDDLHQIALLLPVTVGIKDIKDLLDLLVCLHPHGHHAQELVQLDGPIVILAKN